MAIKDDGEVADGEVAAAAGVADGAASGVPVPPEADAVVLRVRRAWLGRCGLPPVRWRSMGCGGNGTSSTPPAARTERQQLSGARSR